MNIIEQQSRAPSKQSMHGQKRKGKEPHHDDGHDHDVPEDGHGHHGHAHGHNKCRGGVDNSNPYLSKKFKTAKSPPGSKGITHYKTPNYSAIKSKVLGKNVPTKKKLGSKHKKTESMIMP